MFGLHHILWEDGCLEGSIVIAWALQTIHLKALLLNSRDYLTERKTKTNTIFSIRVTGKTMTLTI